MLLFSTLLEINEKMTKDTFIQLVLKWNQGSPHEENIIRGIEWNGERNIRYGTDTMWLAIEEYRNENIIAIRYEKTETDGVVWDTDYVMNFNEMKMSIQLDRSYLEEALVIDPSFSTPHFITLLIEGGYLKNDGELPMLRKPTFIKTDNVSLLTDVINVNALADYVPWWCAQYDVQCDFKSYYPNKILAGWQYSQSRYIGNTNVDMNEWYM